MNGENEIKPNIFDPSESRLPVIPWIISGLTNGLFIIIWIFLQWGTNQIVKHFPLEVELDKIVFTIFGYLFSISTLIPIIFFILKDTITMYRSLKKNIYGK